MCHHLWLSMGWHMPLHVRGPLVLHLVLFWRAQGLYLHVRLSWCLGIYLGFRVLWCPCLQIILVLLPTLTVAWRLSLCEGLELRGWLRMGTRRPLVCEPR